MEPKIKVKFTASGSVQSFSYGGRRHEDGAVVDVFVKQAEMYCRLYPDMFTTDIDAHPEGSKEKEDGSEKSEPSLKKKSMAPRRNRAMKARNRK